MDYWFECIAESLDEVGIVATEEQIKTIAGNVESSEENHSMYSGRDCTPDPRDTEYDRLKRELKEEQDKVICEDCKGTGNQYPNPCGRPNYSTCTKCRGEGRHKP